MSSAASTAMQVVQTLPQSLFHRPQRLPVQTNAGLTYAAHEQTDSENHHRNSFNHFMPIVVVTRHGPLEICFNMPPRLTEARSVQARCGEHVAA